ncbi:MAG: glyoxalase [Pseudomonadota bacterium]
MPARDFALSKQFYQDIGFDLGYDEGGLAHFSHGACAFLLQDYYDKVFAENLMLHLLVEDVDAWWSAIHDADIEERYAVGQSRVELRPWKMRDFTLGDPSGVLWRIAENTVG